MATTYTGRAALLIAIFFCFLDITITIFGLAWDGKDFTFDNIGHWWNDFFSPNYDFRTNPIDFLILALIRTTVLLIGGLAVWCNPTTVPGRIQTLSNVHFALMLLIVAFSPTKLLAFAEIDSTALVNRLAVGDWILMIWSLFAALFVQLIWGSIFTKVKPTDCYLHLPDDSTSRVEAERAAVAKETFELIQRLATYMFKEWPFYIIAFSCLFAYSLARVFIPYYMGEVVAAVMQPEGQAVDYSKLNKCVGVMALLSFLGAVFGGLRGGSFTYAQARVDRRIRNDLFRALVHQEIGFFDANKTGEITSRLNADCQTMSNTLSLYVNVLMRNIVMLFGSMIFMFSLSWRLSMVTFIAVPIIFLISKIYGVYYDRLADETQTSVAKANDVAEEVISSMRTVKSFACEKFEARRFYEFLNITLKIATRKSLAHVGFLWTSELLQMGILVLVLWFGGHLVLKDKVESGLLVSFLLYQFQLGENLRELGEVWNGLMQSVGSSRKVFEFMDRVPVIQNDGKVNNLQLTGKIEFQNVKFSYPLRPDVPIMKDLTFTVNPGEVVALVGPSGGGKSSCIALLEHFYEPVAGQILLDGIPIRDYEHKFIHMKIALVGQEPVLYARSVHENIGYGMENVTEEQVQTAAKMANAHNFIMDTTEQYGTDVGEKGSQMSGGQKQRIAIARALVRHPVVLLLDEATSALDSESEHLVQEAIYKNLQGKTVILIAHRLSTVEKADKIIVINKGRVEQMGVHQELLQQDGIYKTLVQRQMLGGENTGEVEKEPPKMKPVARPRRIETPSAGQSIAHSMLGTSFTSNSPFV